MSNQDLPFGIDISRWQYSADGRQKPDFGKVQATCEYIAIRSSISWGYTDPWFTYSWEHCLGMPRMAYHVPYFGESPIRQVDHWFSVVEPHANWDYDRLVLDNELQHNNSAQRITDVTNQMLQIVRSRTGFFPLIYSRAEWVNRCMFTNQLPNGIQWWLAQYLWKRPAPLFTPEHPGPPTLPRGVSDWLIHQTGEHYDGRKVGVASRYVDTNRWNGTSEDVLKYFNMYDESPPIPPFEQDLDWLLDIHTENVQNHP